jgi:TonB family protein
MAVESSPIMLTAWNLAVLIAINCWSGMGQTSSTASAQTVPAPSATTAADQGPFKSTPEELKLDPIEISKAIYPQAAKEQKIQGQVVGNILVSESGQVESVRIDKGDPVLAAAAEEAARGWKFRPSIKDGKPLALVARATFNFVLSDNVAESKDVAADLDHITMFPIRIRVSSGVSQRLLLSKVNPSYPAGAQARRIQGVVLLHAIIGKDGKIADLEATSGPEVLVPSAIEAVRQWQYRPYLILGRPLEVDTLIQVNFTLQ